MTEEPVGACYYCGSPTIFRLTEPTWHLYAGTYLCVECNIAVITRDTVTDAEKRAGA